MKQPFLVLENYFQREVIVRVGIHMKYIHTYEIHTNEIHVVYV